MGGHLPPTPPPPLVMDRSGIASRYGAAAAAPRMRGGAALDLQAILGLSMTTGARAVARGRYPAGCGENFPRSVRGCLSLFERNLVSQRLEVFRVRAWDQIRKAMTDQAIVGFLFPSAALRSSSCSELVLSLSKGGENSSPGLNTLSQPGDRPR
jgi:hypothetical protein